MQYTYEIKGTTPNDETWTWQGRLDLHSVDDFVPMIQRGIVDTFNHVASGDAAGSPGTTIPGPYQVTSLILTAVVEAGTPSAAPKKAA